MEDEERGRNGKKHENGVERRNRGSNYCLICTPCWETERESKKRTKLFFSSGIIFSAYLVPGGKSLRGEIGKAARDRISTVCLLNFRTGFRLDDKGVFGNETVPSLFRNTFVTIQAPKRSDLSSSLCFAPDMRNNHEYSFKSAPWEQLINS